MSGPCPDRHDFFIAIVSESYLSEVDSVDEVKVGAGRLRHTGRNYDDHSGHYGHLSYQTAFAS